MQSCASCEMENPAGNRFCGRCGEALAATCPSCGTPATPGFQFCGACGSALADAALASVARTAPDADRPGLPTTERRVCSVLFADLVGFTPLSEAKDPEEVRELLSRYFALARTVIGRYGGVVEKFIGDAVMAVWGTPVAVEGDSERAVRAGLELVSAVSALGAEVDAPGLALRAGIVTGEVAAAVGAVGEGMVAGDAVNTAARVQGVATPGTVWVDAATQRLSAAAIGFRDAGPHLLKGKSEPVGLWEATRVLSSVGGAQRVDGLEAPMIGRDAEDRTLRELFHMSADRRLPRLVVVSGAAGAGKSRLGWEFEKYVDGLADTVLWHRGRCLSYGDGIAYWALADAIRQRFAIAEDDPVDDAREKFLAGVSTWVPAEDQRRYVGVRLGRLLGLTHPEDNGIALDRDDLFAGWRLFLERLADSAPVVLLIEDAEHADEGLLDFFEHVVDWAREAPIYAILFARSELTERRPGLGVGPHRTSLTLDPLDEASMNALVTALVRDLPADGVAAIVEQAEGNPLFAVETVRALIDKDVIIPQDGEYRLVGDVGSLSVPDSLHSLLAARLDSLDARLRSLTADAAVLGTSFPSEALAAVAGLPLDEVTDALTELVRRGVFQVSTDPLSPQRGSYEFSQNMLRQVAYDTLSKRDRRARHLAVAAHLQTVFAAGGDEIMDLLAQHYLDALAAASDEQDHEILMHALDSLVRAAGRSERAGAQGRAAESYSRAAELVRDRDPLQAAGLLESASQAYEAGGRFDEARKAAEAARETYLAQGERRDAARVLAVVGRVLKSQGRLSEARALLDEALLELRTDPDVSTVRALCESAAAAAFSGGTEARDLADEALGLGQSMDVPPSLKALLFSHLGVVNIFHHRRDEAVAALQYSAELAERSGDRAAQARALLNLAAAQLGHDPAAALEVARTAADLSRATGYRFLLATAVSNSAVAALALGDWDSAHEVLESGAREDGLAEDAAYVVMLGLVRALRGDLTRAPDEAALTSLRASDDVQDRGLLSWYDGVMAEASGHPERALGHLRQLFKTDSELDLAFEAVLWSWPLAARCSFDIGDLDEVRRLLAILDAQPPGRVPAVMRGCRGVARARLAAAAGEPPDPVHAMFAEGVAQLRSASNPYHLAHGLLDHCAFLLEQGRDCAAALDEAMLIGEGLGAADIQRRVAAFAAAVSVPG